MEGIGNLIVNIPVHRIQTLLLANKLELDVLVCLLFVFVLIFPESDDADSPSFLYLPSQLDIRVFVLKQSFHVLADIVGEILDVTKFVQLQQQTEHIALPVFLVQLNAISLLFTEISELLVNKILEENFNQLNV